MKVYRYVNEIELKNLLNDNKDNLGRVFYQEKKIKYNNHKYKKDVKYLHFFKNKDAMINIRNLISNKNGNYYFCCFDIPKLTLLLSSGKGFYEPHGYDYFYDEQKEYAIEVSKYNPSWLIDFKIDDYMQNNNNNNLVL